MELVVQKPGCLPGCVTGTIRLKEADWYPGLAHSTPSSRGFLTAPQSQTHSQGQEEREEALGGREAALSRSAALQKG